MPHIGSSDVLMIIVGQESGIHESIHHGFHRRPEVVRVIPACPVFPDVGDDADAPGNGFRVGRSVSASAPPRSCKLSSFEPVVSLIGVDPVCWCSDDDSHLGALQTEEIPTGATLLVTSTVGQAEVGQRVRGPWIGHWDDVIHGRRLWIIPSDQEVNRLSAQRTV